MPLVLPNPVVGTPINEKEKLQELMKMHRALSVRHDELGTEIILNDILALLIHNHQYEQAESFVASCDIKLPHRANNQAARFYYYVGLVRALRLEYVEAHQCLQQALRKSPERAFGFRIAATKLSLVIQLLLGEMPPRSDFLVKDMRESLAPYLLLAGCVRFGQLGRFMTILGQYQETFEHDHTYSLIIRVRQHVVKTGLRRICQAYSRISIMDVCKKLSLQDIEDAEYILSKAIYDGVISGVIDNEKQELITNDTVDVYATSEPLHALQRRIMFLNTIHNETKRSMRYSETDPDLAEERKKAEQENRDALERALEEGDGFDDLDFEDGV